MNSSSPFSINQYSKNPSPFESSDTFVYNQTPLKRSTGSQSLFYDAQAQSVISRMAQNNQNYNLWSKFVQDQRTFNVVQDNQNPIVLPNPKPVEMTSCDMVKEISPLNAIMTAIREEISYRFLLERVILPAISPQYAAFSMARTTISTLFFTARYLQYVSSKEGLTKEVFCRALLSIVCSVAQEKFGLVASIFIHVGENLRIWKNQHNQSFSELIQKIIAIKFTDVVNTNQFYGFFGGILKDAISPLILTGVLASRVKSFWNASA